MSTFNEMCAPISRKYVAEQGIVVPNWSETIQFKLHFFVFALEKQPKNPIFRVFLSLIDPFVATFNEKFPPTSRKYIAEQSIVMPNWSKTFQTFRSHSSVFATETLPKNLIFCVFFASNRPFGGYFQWNACINFQKICIWIRYSDAKLIKNVWNF